MLQVFVGNGDLFEHGSIASVVACSTKPSYNRLSIGAADQA